MLGDDGGVVEDLFLFMVFMGHNLCHINCVSLHFLIK